MNEHILTKLLSTVLLIATTFAVAAAPSSNIRISELPSTNTATDEAELPIIQKYEGRETNDNFRISVANLLQGRVIPVTFVSNVYYVTENVYFLGTNVWDELYVGVVYVTNQVEIGTYITLGDTTNRLSDDGTQLTYNGEPLVNVENFYISNFYATNISVYTTTITSNLYVTNLFAEFSYVSNFYTTNLFSIHNYTSNLYVTNIIEGNRAVISNIYVTNLVVQIITNVESLWVTNVYVARTLFLDGTNVGKINPTDKYIPYRAGTNTFWDSPLYVEDSVVKTIANIGAGLAAGATAVVNVLVASATNNVTGALTFTHATNGVDGLDLTHVRWFFNGSGSDQTLTIPSGWRTNVFSYVPSKLTNATITVMYVKCGGPTASAASQTNCYVSFEFYK